MRKMSKTWWVFGGLLLVGGLATVQALSSGSTRRTLGGTVASSGEVRGLLAAVPFEVEQGYEHTWRGDRPLYKRGWLLALAVDPELVRVTELAQPVLCAEDEILARYNHGAQSGCVVALLPTNYDPSTRAGRDALIDTVFHFADPELPERLDGTQLAAQLAEALRTGARPIGAAQVVGALKRGGAPIVVKERDELDRLAAEWITRYAPEDQAKAAELSVPVTR